MAQPNNYADLDGPALWDMVFQLMDEGLAAGGGIHAPAAPFREVAAMRDELVARDPDLNVAAIEEFRTVLRRALAGEPGATGHA